MINVGRFMNARTVPMSPRDAYTIHARNGATLGIVEWYEAWHQYVLQPEGNAVFSVECLRDLAGLIERCNRAALRNQVTS